MFVVVVFCFWKVVGFFCIWICVYVGIGGCWLLIKFIFFVFKIFKIKIICNDNFFIIYSINGLELKYMNGFGICSI